MQNDKIYKINNQNLDNVFDFFWDSVKFNFIRDNFSFYYYISALNSSIVLSVLSFIGDLWGVRIVGLPYYGGFAYISKLQYILYIFMMIN